MNGPIPYLPISKPTQNDIEWLPRVTLTSDENEWYPQFIFNGNDTKLYTYLENDFDILYNVQGLTSLSESQQIKSPDNIPKHINQDIIRK